MSINPCTLCSAPCCKNYMITTTSFDILRISKHAKLEPKEFAKIVPCTIFNATPQTVLYLSDGDSPYGYLLTIKSHPCYFLDIKNKCMVHKYAPLCCRKYPYDSTGKMVNAIYCPFYSKILFQMQGESSSISKQHNDEMIEYMRIVTEWNNSPGKMDDCLDWIMDRTKIITQK